MQPLFDPERAVIGALLTDPEAVRRCGTLRPEMFRQQMLGDIFRLYLQASDLGYRLTLPDVAQRLSEYSQAEIAFLARECMESSVLSVEAGNYAAAVVRDYKARTAADLLQKAKLQANGIDRQIGELINQLEAVRGEEITTARSLSQIITSEAAGYFTDKRKPYLLTGFEHLDELLGGFEGGDVIVIGARPAVGKSAFATQVIGNIAELGKRVLFYNLEMPQAQVYERLLSRQSGISLQRIRKGLAFLGDERERFTRANEKLAKFDLWISSGAKTVTEIRNECRNMRPDAIIIDYLQLIQAERKFTNRAAEVGDISKSIKALAMELQVPIIVLSQLNRLSEGRPDREPTMAELRESGDVEQDASVILLLWNCDKNDSSRKGLLIAKNRQGMTGKTWLVFNGERMSFEETINVGFQSVSGEDENPFRNRGGV